MPTGSVPIHMPSTMMLIGSVASAGSGANVAPMMPVVATVTVLLPPASACATASTTALRAARRSSVKSSADLAATVMVGSREAAPSSGHDRGTLLRKPQVRSAMHRYDG